MNYAPTKFEIAMSNSVEDTSFDLDLGHTKYPPVPSTSCDLCIYKVAMTNSLGEDTITRNVRDGQADNGPTLVQK